MSDASSDSTQEEIEIIDKDELWTDVTPIPQADSEQPLVQIAYHPDYRKAMDLFRALLKMNELSERALELTTFILQINKSHYTVWNYRTRILKYLHKAHPEGQHVQKELEMLNKYMPDMRKSYQAWQHRALIVALLEDVSKEIEFVNQTLKADAKNYHTWTYRQALLCNYNRPEMWAGELACTEDLLVEDIRNNSAWNHRFFVVFDTISFHSPGLSAEELRALVGRETSFAKRQILKAPNNPSAWNYLRGVLERGAVQLDTVQDFVAPLTKTAGQLEAEDGWPAGLNKHADLPVVAAVEFQADLSSQSYSDAARALELYDLLAQKLDPIRKGYWLHRSQCTAARHASLTPAAQA